MLWGTFAPSGETSAPAASRRIWFASLCLPAAIRLASIGKIIVMMVKRHQTSYVRYLAMHRAIFHRLPVANHPERLLFKIIIVFSTLWFFMPEIV
jgi:hypothetical protein